MTAESQFPENLLDDYRDKTIRAEDRQVTVKSSLLAGVSVAYAVTGGIAAVESVRIIRELRRHGALVRVYASAHALQFITPLSLEWASGNPVVSSLTASAEQVLTEDILLVCPATANIIAKAAVGIADDTVSTLVAGALGKRYYLKRHYTDKKKYALENNEKPGIPPAIVIAPAMHDFLAAHPSLTSHRNFLEEQGCVFLSPRREAGEEKEKIADPDGIAMGVAHAFYRNYYLYRDPNRQAQKNKGFDPMAQEVLITAGATTDSVDGVRLFTNRGTGETGLTMAKYFYGLGLRVHLLFPSARKGKGSLPNYLIPQTSFFEDYDSYQKTVSAILKSHPVSWAVFTAAVSDFKPDCPFQGKMNSDKSVDITFLPRPKVIAEVRESHPDLIMTVFKYTVGKSIEELSTEAKKMAEKYDFVAANRREDITPEKKTRYFFGGKNAPRVSHHDIELARQIAEEIIPPP